VDHTHGDRKCYRKGEVGSHGHPACPTSPRQGRPGNCDAGPAQRRPLILGVGLGGDQFAGEFSRTGEQLDDKARGEMLDEALEILTGAWSGETVNHRGKHYLIDDVRFLPRPAQEPGIPVWVAAYAGNMKPLRRAARYDGFFPVNLENVDQFAQAVATVRDLRGDNPAPFDVAVELPPGTNVAPYAEAGATWWMTGIEPGASLDEVRSVIREGPAV
jgi:hypothetical protein